MKTIKRVSAFLGAMTIVVCMMMPAITTLAADLSGYMADSAGSPVAAGFVADYADVLTDDQVSFLTEEIENMISNYGYGFAILTGTDNAGRSPEVFSADFLYENGFDNYPGAAVFYLSLDPDDRCWLTTSINEAESIFNSDVTYEIDEAVDGYIRSGDYFEGFKAMLSRAKEAFSYYLANGEYRAESHEDYGDGETDGPESLGTVGIIAAAAGAIGAGINKKSMASAMKISPQISAKEYVTPGSFNLRRLDEHFLYTTLTKVPKPKNETKNHGSSFSGGFSSGGGHFSSGGRRF